MQIPPLTQEETAKANAYIASLGPDKLEDKKSLWKSFTEGPDVFNPIIRALINQNNG